jgi:hypothetical protein
MFYADVKLSQLRFLRGEDRSKMFENSFVESGISGSHDDEYVDDCLWEMASCSLVEADRRLKPHVSAPWIWSIFIEIYLNMKLGF